MAMAAEQEDWSDFDATLLDGLRIQISTIKRYEIYYADLNPTIGSEIKKLQKLITDMYGE